MENFSQENKITETNSVTKEIISMISDLPIQILSKTLIEILTLLFDLGIHPPRKLRPKYSHLPKQI